MDRRQALFARAIHAATLSDLLDGVGVDAWRDARLVLDAQQPARANVREGSPLCSARDRCARADRDIVDRLLLRTLLADALTREPAGERRARLVVEYELQRALDERRTAFAALGMRRTAQDAPTRRRTGKLGGAVTKQKRERERTARERVGKAVLTDLRRKLGREPSGREWADEMAADPRVLALPQYQRKPPKPGGLRRGAAAFIAANPVRRRRRA